MAPVFSKKRKQVSGYWKRKAAEYHEQSDCAPKTDSGDSGDHLCHPEDPQATRNLVPKEKIRLVFSQAFLL